MLEYIIKTPEKELINPPLLILLHGYGSNEEDLFSFASQLPDELLIISARAPLSLGFGSYAWYSINFDATTNAKFSNLEEARESINKIEEFINFIIKKYRVNNNKIFLLGFSQGAILSYSIALRNPKLITNVLPLSGYINTELIPENLNPDLVNNLDLFISHGTVDQVLPIAWVRKSLPILDSLDINYTFNEYPIGHGVNPQNFNDFKKWIVDRL